MERNFFGVLCCLLFVFSGCDKNSEKTIDDPINGLWNLQNVSGGFAGIDDDFEKGVIIWTFDSQSATLIIKNNNVSNSIYDGLASGSYSYSVRNQNENQYLLVNNNELGEIFLSQDEMIVDQNSMSNGSGADNFVIKLIK